MKPDRSSITAEHNALLRTHETLRPENQRELDDPFAVFFIPDRLMAAKDRDDQIQRTVQDWETRFPGVGNAIIARTCFIDACLEEALRAGMCQLVILGAGYDTRALRFDALRAGITVFELDHPATQTRKRRLLDRFGQLDTSHIRYIPMDFRSESLEIKLFARGYDRALTTLFIWEGVTYYIPAESIDRTLAFVAGFAPRGSCIVFDYIPQAAVKGATSPEEAGNLRERLKHIGEEIIFGFAPQQLDRFMAVRGLAVLKNLSATRYAADRFKALNRSRAVSSMFRFAQTGIA